MSKIQDWDLNVFFEEVWDELHEEYVSADVISINPVLWTLDNGVSNVTYTNILYKTTFAEARYLRSQYPEKTYGYDWTDSLASFLEIAPPRLRSLLSTLPDPNTVSEKDVLELVG